MITFTISEAGAKFPEIAKLAASGEEVLITNSGEPYLKVTVASKLPSSGALKKRSLGSLTGQIQISDDFDEWPEDIRKTWEE
jgi:prevent-host-death family protein